MDAKTLTESYQWSDDPARLKELLDMGTTVIFTNGTSNLRALRAEGGEIDLNQGSRFGKQWIRTEEFISFFTKKGNKFIDPRPLAIPVHVISTCPKCGEEASLDDEINDALERFARAAHAMTLPEDAEAEAAGNARLKAVQAKFADWRGEGNE